MDPSQSHPNDPPRNEDVDSRLKHIDSHGLTPSRAISGSQPSGTWQAPTPEELQSQLPQYKVLDVLGRGGMGAVYKGWQVSLDRYVAIKILPQYLDDGDENFSGRFKQEARTMAKFQHPGIVAIFDAGETATGLLYIVMEFVEGTDVSKMVKEQGRLPPAHALAITAHVCDALAYAHERGVIHRDIKPANIMMNMEGQVKVADFGLAKSTIAGAGGLTRSNMAMGTPNYIAPEALIPGMAVDGRADLYAVGVMLYNMLTGKVPRGVFKPASEQVGSDPRLDGIIRKAMETEREDRYQSAGELRRDLDVILTTPMEQASAPPPQQQQQQTAPAHMSVMRGPGPSAGTPASKPAASQSPPQSGAHVSTADKDAGAPGKKSPAGMIMAIVGAVAAIGLGAFFIFKKPGSSSSRHEEAPILAPGTSSGSSASPGTATGQSLVTSAATIAAAAKDAPFVNTLGMKFVPVPITGGPTNGQRVLFSVWETRVQDYEAFAKETRINWPKPSFPQEPTHPAVNLTWDDATKFCAWLTERERKAGKLGANETYRLPTDHEWSCAVGIGDREDPLLSPKEKSGKLADVFPWGSAWPPPTGTGNFYGEEMVGQTLVHTMKKPEGYRDGFIGTAPVGSFSPDRLGLYDLSGNALEWCEEWVDASQKVRVLRGGSWLHPERAYLLSSGRDLPPPFSRHPHFGFRCVLSAVSSTPRSGVPPAADKTSRESGTNAASSNVARTDGTSTATGSAPPPGSSGSFAAATKDAPFVNTLGMKFVPVPITGGPSGGKRVLFSIWHTRVQDYEKKGSPRKPKFEQGPTHPAVGVQYYDAKSFCNWLTEQDRNAGKLGANERYRLPTDHEWSCAAGIGDREDPAKLPAEKSGMIPGEYPWGTQWPPPKGSGNFAGEERGDGRSVSAGYNDGFVNTSPVGSFAANRFGLYDMGGNVLQWCDSVETSTEGRKYYTLRGSGCTSVNAVDLLSSSRSKRPPNSSSDTWGFRCVLAIDDAVK